MTLDPKEHDKAVLTDLADWLGKLDLVDEDEREGARENITVMVETLLSRLHTATAPSGQAPLEGVKPMAFADPAAIRALRGTPATAIYLSKEGSAAYSMALYAIADERWKAQAQQATSVIGMIRAMIGEMFGPIANIESEEATLLRGPEAKHDGEAILEALQRVASVLLPASAEPVKCVACEDSPKAPNIPCAVCGASPPASGAVEAGWQIVPKEPDAKMRVAGIEAAHAVELTGAPLRDSIPTAYRAMLSAAPTEGR